MSDGALQSPLAARGLRPIAILGGARPHGVRLKYLAGCRCLKCRMANSNYETSRARARRNGDWNGIVDAAPAREHLRKLSRAGVGYKTAADAASVARSVVAKIVSGAKPRARARTVRRLLAVTPAARADHSFVSAKRTWQLIGFLLDEGFTKAELARRKAVKVAWTNVHSRLRFSDTHQCHTRVEHYREIRQRAVDSIAKRSGASA